MYTVNLYSGNKWARQYGYNPTVYTHNYMSHSKDILFTCVPAPHVVHWEVVDLPFCILQFCRRQKGEDIWCKFTRPGWFTYMWFKPCPFMKTFAVKHQWLTLLPFSPPPSSTGRSFWGSTAATVCWGFHKRSKRNFVVSCLYDRFQNSGSGHICGSRTNFYGSRLE